MSGRLPALVALIGWAVAVSIAVEAPGQTLSLEGAVALAHRNAPAARAATLRITQASAKTAQATSVFYPALRINTSYTASDNPVQVFSYALNQGRFSLASDLNHPSAADNWTLSGQFNVRLFSGRDWFQRRAAQSFERGMHLSRDATLDEITLQVTGAFLAVLTAEEWMPAAESSVRAYTSSEEVIASRVTTGTALRTELLNVQVQRAQAEERLLQATNAHARAKENLRLAVGLDTLPYTDFGSLDDLALVEPSTGEATDRPEVGAKTAVVDAARAELRAAKTGYLPIISAFAGLDRFQGWDVHGTGDSWSAGVMLEWSLFDGLYTSAVISEKRALMRLAEEDARQIRLQISVELATAARKLREATGRIDVMNRAVALAGESALLTRQRLAQGMALASQVIDAENALVQAEVGLAQAKADRWYTIAALRRALNLPIMGDAKS